MTDYTDLSPKMVGKSIKFIPLFIKGILIKCLILTGGFLLLQNFSVAISVSSHVCFILVLILTSMFLR